MHVRFAPQDEQFIRSQIENGFYTNETELVRDAVRRLREGGQHGKTSLLFALQEAEASIRGGKTVAYSKALMSEIKKTGASKAKANMPYHGSHAIP